MILKTLRQNKIYIIIFFICFLIMILSALNETNIFNIVGNFIFNADYRENFTLAESTIKTNINLFQVIKQVLSNYSWKFDYILIFGTNFFQILLPFIVSIIGVSFYNDYNTIYNFSIHKQKSYSKFIKNNIVKKSLKMGATMFLAFLLFYICCLFITKGDLSVYMGRTLFIDILGESFYNKYTYIYYILDGSVRFFVVPFIYTYFSCCMATILKTQKQVFFSSNIYYYGLSIIGFGLYYIFGEWSIYINPSVIMASGTYNSVNTFLLLFVNLIPIIIGWILLKRRFKYADVY